MKLSIQDVSKCLNLPVSTVERWIRQGRIPMKKSGTTYFIQTEVLRKWAMEHNLLFYQPTISESQMEDSIGVTDLLTPCMKRGGIFHHVQGDSVHSVLKSAVRLIPNISDEFRIVLYEKLIEREQLNSTGIGNGVAIPHPRSPISGYLDHSMVTTCFLDKPIHYRAIDDKPVFVLFLLICPSIKHHLNLLSRLAYCVRDASFQTFLTTLPSSEMLLEKISAFDSLFDGLHQK